MQSNYLIVAFLIFAAVTLVSYWGVERYRRWSVRRNVFDIPNDRSSHKEPTPRGGGIVIVVLTLIGYLMAAAFFPQNFSWGLLVGSLIIAGISIADDIRSIAFPWRLLAHSIAAGIAIYDLGYFQLVTVPVIDQMITLRAAGPVLTFLWIIWMINSYNFMDGIDGIAGVQAVAASAGWAIISTWFDRPDTALLSTLVLGSTVGFLIHNWAPARIFMGDIGSAFLGFVFAILPLSLLISSNQSIGYLPVLATFLMWMFLFDSVLTFFRRLIRREKVWQPHRSHFYQLLVISGFSHSFVSKIYGLGASIIAASAIVAFVYGGNWWFLAVFLMLVSPLTVILMSRSKKD